MGIMTGFCSLTVVVLVNIMHHDSALVEFSGNFGAHFGAVGATIYWSVIRFGAFFFELQRNFESMTDYEFHR